MPVLYSLSIRLIPSCNDLRTLSRSNIPLNADIHNELLKIRLDHYSEFRDVSLHVSNGELSIRPIKIAFLLPTDAFLPFRLTSQDYI